MTTTKVDGVNKCHGFDRQPTETDSGLARHRAYVQLLIDCCSAVHAQPHEHHRHTTIRGTDKTPSLRQNTPDETKPPPRSKYKLPSVYCECSERKTDQQFTMYFIYTAPHKKSRFIHRILMNTQTQSTSSGAYTTLFLSPSAYKITTARLMTSFRVYRHAHESLNVVRK